MENEIKTLIIDDEKNARNALKIVIEEFAPNITLIGMAASAKEGLDMINSLDPDLVFVDIQMPHMTGVELMESIGTARSFDLVFLTAFNNYAHEAFSLKAFDYLLKPIRITDFLSLVERLSQKKEVAAESSHYENLRKNFADRLAIPSSEGIEFITIADIVRVQASGSYVEFFLLNGQTRLFSKNLKAIEKLLYKHSFFRTHKSHLINVNHIQKYAPYKDGGSIVMVDGSEIVLSRRQKDAFMDLYKT